MNLLYDDETFKAAAAGAHSLHSITPDDEYGRARTWLDEKIKQAKIYGVLSEVVCLTPAMASVLLNRNPSNRKISQHKVETYARDIASGSFCFNGESIIIADDGNLNDGQHRCEAVVAAGMSIQTLIAFGVSRSSRTTVNQGKGRRISDYLEMEGHANSKQVATVARYWLIYSNLGTLRVGMGLAAKYNPTNSEIKIAVEENPEFQKAIENVPAKNFKAFGGQAFLAFIIYVLARRTGNWSDAISFVDMLVNGSNLPAGSPVLYARTRMSIATGKMKQPEKAELLFRAWNAYRAGETPTKLQILGGKLPKLER